MPFIYVVWFYLLPRAGCYLPSCQGRPQQDKGWKIWAVYRFIHIILYDRFMVKSVQIYKSNPSFCNFRLFLLILAQEERIKNTSLLLPPPPNFISFLWQYFTHIFLHSGKQYRNKDKWDLGLILWELIIREGRRPVHQIWQYNEVRALPLGFKSSPFDGEWKTQ